MSTSGDRSRTRGGGDRRRTGRGRRRPRLHASRLRTRSRHGRERCGLRSGLGDRYRCHSMRRRSPRNRRRQNRRDNGRHRRGNRGVHSRNSNASRLERPMRGGSRSARRRWFQLNRARDRRGRVTSGALRRARLHGGSSADRRSRRSCRRSRG
jgi:hypothetical protein